MLSFLGCLSVKVTTFFLFQEIKHKKSEKYGVLCPMFIRWDRWDEWDKWDKWEILIKRSVTHQALALPSLPSSEALLIKRSAPIYPMSLPTQISAPISCQKGAKCYTRQKSHRWVVLCVRPIGGIFSRGRNRPLITINYLMAIASISTRAPIGNAAT